jgi:UDP-glucose 4-epimerase
LGKDIEPFVSGAIRPGDIRHCTGNPKAAADDLGWTAQVSFDWGIAEYGKGLLA